VTEKKSDNEEKFNIGAHVYESSESNKTGSWRAFKPIVTNKCVGCGTCEKTCPDGAIKVNPKTKKAEIDYDYCKGCLICMNVCPVKAIKKEIEK